MLLVGSDDGVYRLSGIEKSEDLTSEQVLESERVRRVCQLEGFDGAFAATQSGLYHSTDGDEWTALEVPQERVYSVGGRPNGDELYAGTRPAHVYAARTRDGDDSVRTGDALPSELEWRELDGFQDLPSREDWRLPRHENLAQVRDVHIHPARPDRVVAAVEVGGVHVSEDGGGIWTERKDGMHDDVHELHLVGEDEFVAATGFGLFRSTDAGRSWTRLDEGFDQRYFRAVYAHDGVVYAGAALSSSSSWEDDDADPELFACRDGETLEVVDHPRPDETVTGITAVDDTVVAGTHRGTLLAERDGGWAVTGSFPVPGETTGKYTPLLSFEL